jgi:hypothetical protein
MDWIKSVARRLGPQKRLNQGRALRRLALALGLALTVGSAVPGRAAMDGKFIYAAQDDGTLHVYDINNSHSPVKTNRVFTASGGDIRGVCAAAPTHCFYVMYNVNNATGYVACVDLTNDVILWNKAERTNGVDRGVVTPDGKTLYIPSYEGEPTSSNVLVVDALTGNLISKIPITPLTHDAICSLDGTTVFISNKNNDQRIRGISTASNQVSSTTSQFSGVVQPFAINGRNTFVIVDVIGIYGFVYADLVTGHILGTNLFTGTTWTGLGSPYPHGIGMSPDEHEAWVCDRGPGNHWVHVFDITSLPYVQTRLVTVSHDSPAWLTFSIDGRYCYVAGEKGLGEITDVIDTSNYIRVASLAPSEDLLEVDFSNGTVTQTGDQYGIGRLTNSAPVAPGLNLGSPSNSVAVSWPGWASDYHLSFATNLTAPVVWAAVTNPVSFTNGFCSVAVSNNSASGYYRLHKP